MCSQALILSSIRLTLTISRSASLVDALADRCSSRAIPAQAVGTICLVPTPFSLCPHPPCRNHDHPSFCLAQHSHRHSLISHHASNERYSNSPPSANLGQISRTLSTRHFAHWQSQLWYAFPSGEGRCTFLLITRTIPLRLRADQRRWPQPY